MNKMSSAQASELLKTAASNLRALSGELQAVTTERDELKEKVASYERKERAEKLAHQMEQKGLQSGIPFQEKVAGILKHERIDVLEEAIGLSAPQVKVAFIHDDERAETSNEVEGGSATNAFGASLFSLE